MRTLFAFLAATTVLSGAAQAATVYPLDRATILAGSPFDFKNSSMPSVCCMRV